MKKNKLQLWLAASLVLLLSSCLGGDDSKIDSWNLSNCQINSFSLLNDSIPGLKKDNKVRFTIDQVNGLIYNKDSMPYGTVINRKLVCKMTYEVSPSRVEVYQAAVGDSMNWNGKDSLNFSDYVRFEVYSYDGKALKRYTVKLNIHQQNPDSMIWNRVTNQLLGKSVQDQKTILREDNYWMYIKTGDAYELYQALVTDKNNWKQVALTGLSGKSFLLTQLTEFNGYLFLPASDGSLYQSKDGLSWEIVAETPQIKSVLGAFSVSPPSKQASVLATIIQDGETLRFAAMGVDKKWKTGMALPVSFPVFGFSNVDYLSMHFQRLMVVAGRDEKERPTNQVWETMNGLNWVRLTDDQTYFFEKREGAALAKYDNQLFLIGGINASGEALTDIYRSKDNGVTWALGDSLVRLPASYNGRGYASVCVDKDQYMLLFSGKEKRNQNMLDELWCGRINRLGYKE